MSSTSKSNPEQSAEPPAKKRPRITSDEPDSSQSDGGDHKVIHPSGGDDGKQSNVSTAKEDHSKGEQVKHPAKADNDDVIGNDAAASEGIIREGKKSILKWKETTIDDQSEDSDDCDYVDRYSDDEEMTNSHPSDDLR